MLTRCRRHFDSRRTIALLGLGVAVWLIPTDGVAIAEEHDEESLVVREQPVVVVRSTTDRPGFTWTMEGHRSFLGVQTVDLTPELREHFGAPAEAGVLVARIVEESPASEGGVQVGDIISAVDGEPITSPSELARSVGHREPGDVIQLEVWRQGQLQPLQATLAERKGPWVDIRQFRTPEGHVATWNFSDSDVEGVIELETETLNQAIEKLNEEMDSPEWHTRVHISKQHQGALMKRIEVLEQRLKELESELQELVEVD